MSYTQPPSLRSFHRYRQGFTLIELLVVIGIIALLAGILIPVIGHVRIAGYEATTKSQIQTLSSAIEQYHNTFDAYPGPVANANLIGGSNPIANAPTGTENMTLGLMGGAILTAGKFAYQPNDVGAGTLSLNPAKANRYPALLEAKTGNLQSKNGAAWVAGGKDLLQPYGDSANPYKDTTIPEMLDRFPDPLPILYIRANVGATGITSGSSPQYNVKELAPYNFPEPTANNGAHRVQAALSGNPTDPFLLSVSGTPAFDRYFGNPNLTNTPYQKDGYILISAGRDRLYFSADDICNFGNPK